MEINKIHELFLESSSACTDTRSISKDCMFFALKGANFNGNKFALDAINKGAKYAIIDDEDYAIGKTTILVKDVLETLQELSKYHRNYLKIPIIALTGSNGKTTTKELINTVLSQRFKTTATVGNFNNHIGVPLTLLSMNKDTEIGIVEMGANHQKEIEFLCTIAQPNFGYITNFGKAHLEGFGGIEGVIKGKSELYTYLIAQNHIIFQNTNDQKQLELLNNYKHIYSFGKQLGDIRITLSKVNPFVSTKVDDLVINSNLIGAYNFSNISAAICIGKYFKVSDEQIKTAIESYIPSNNRSQILQRKTNRIILDAYNANPTSMKAALDNLNNLEETPNKVVILGDMFELGESSKYEHQNIANYLTQLNFSKAYLIGEHFANTETSLNTFKSFSDFKDHLQTLEFYDTTILIKGSRGMALERILDII